MAQQVNVTVYNLNSKDVAFYSQPLPAATTVFKDAKAEQRKAPGTNQVYSIAIWKEGGANMQAYVAETISSIVTSANS